MKKRYFIILLIFIASTLFIACNSEGEDTRSSAKMPEENISSWANKRVENILVSMNKEDYKAFSKDFSENMKEQLNEEVFINQILPLSDLIGDYIKRSKELLTTEELEHNNIKLVYSTDYSNEEEEVIATIVFSKASKNIEGLLINSEKIQKMK